MIKKLKRRKLKTHVLVCSKCYQASCWQGIFMCDESKNADVIEMPIDVLRSMELESEEYWMEDDK
jgi:hypothetical protein